MAQAQRDSGERNFKITAQTETTGGYAKGRQRRQEIISAAYDYFSAYGYEESSLRNIASSIGVTHAGLRYHFEAKEDLLTAVLEKYNHECDQIFSTQIITAEAEAKSPWKSVESFIEFIQFGLHNPGFIRLYNSQALLSSHPDNLTFEFFSQRMDTVRGIYTCFLEVLQDQGILHPHLDVPRSASILMATVEGLYLQQLIQPEKGEILAQLHLFLKALIEPNHHEQLAITFEPDSHQCSESLFVNSEL